MNLSTGHLFSFSDFNVPFTVFSASFSPLNECNLDFNYTPCQEAWLDKVCSTVGQEITSSNNVYSFLFNYIDKYGRRFSKSLENVRGYRLREILKATFREPQSLRIELIENFEPKSAWIIILRRDLF